MNGRRLLLSAAMAVLTLVSGSVVAQVESLGERSLVFTGFYECKDGPLPDYWLEVTSLMLVNPANRPMQAVVVLLRQAHDERLRQATSDGSKTARARGRRRTPEPEEVTPEPRPTQTCVMVTRRQSPRGYAVSRETSRSRWMRHPAGQLPRSYAPLGSQAHEGRGGEGRAEPARGKTLKGEKPRRATRCAPVQTAGARWRTLARSKALKAGALSAPFLMPRVLGGFGRRARVVERRTARVQTSGGQRRRRRRTAVREEQSSEGHNPMSGCGTKQGRQARSG
jgi:hypothetical protein